MIKSILLFIATMIFILLICILIFVNMGNFLVVDQDIVTTDAIVILMGGPTTTVHDAAEIYLTGYADEIIMAQTVAKTGEPDPLTGLLSTGETERSRLILIDLGVPEEDIMIIPSMTRSTRDEAVAVSGYLADRTDIHSFILVTKPYHTRRSVITFNRAINDLNRRVEIISRASIYDPFQAEGWWRDEKASRQVVLEFLKIINYYFLELFNVELDDLIDSDQFLQELTLTVTEDIKIALFCRRGQLHPCID